MKFIVYSACVNKEEDYLLPTWAQKITCHAMFWLNGSVVIRVKYEEAEMMTGAFSGNVGKFFSELKLVTDNTFSYAEPNWEATESCL